MRAGLRVFRNPRRGAAATAAQLGAWAIQLAACWALLAALGLSDQAGIGAAAAVLFAVNVTAVVPATPSNIGVFQLAVISVLHTGFGISTADALAYGVILQAVEIATAVALGLPALVREGLTWSDLRVQALSTTPVRLKPQPAPRESRRSRRHSRLAGAENSFRDAAHAEQAGADVGAEHGADLGDEDRLAAEDLTAVVDQRSPPSRRSWMCCTTQPSRPDSWRWRA